MFKKKKEKQKEKKKIGKVILNFFKHKEKIDVVEQDKYHNYLTRQKVRLLGIKDVENDILIDKNNVKYKVIRLSLLEQNGLSAESEKLNRKRLMMISEKVWNKKKYFYIKEKKNNLKKNIQFYEELNKNENRSFYQQARQERIQEMRFFDKNKNISLIMFLEYKDFENVLNIYATTFVCDVLSGKELEECLCMLVNEI